MTNIEKLYELAGVVKYRAVSRHNPLLKFGDYYNLDDVLKFDDNFNIEQELPQFTESKQLELIKWFDYFSYFPTIGAFHMLFHFKDKQYHKIEFVSFEDTLAGLVCELWEDLTDEQKTEIKEKLK